MLPLCATDSAGAWLCSGDLSSLTGISLDESFLQAADRDACSFLTLTSCTWEQDVSCIKVYIPLRGVHNDMIRTHFTRHSVEVGSSWVFISFFLCLIYLFQILPCSSSWCCSHLCSTLHSCRSNKPQCRMRHQLAPALHLFLPEQDKMQQQREQEQCLPGHPLVNSWSMSLLGG